MKIILISLSLFIFSIKSYALQVVDQNGRSITFDSEVKRVVSIPIPAPSMFISIDGKADKLVGVHGLTKTAMKGKFLGKLFPEVLSLPSDFVGKGFNFMPNVERVLELDPDLVFQWGNYGNEIFDPLVNAGLNVAAIKIRNENDTREWIRIMSTVLGKKDKAVKMVSWRDETMKIVKNNAKKVNERKKILYFRLFRNTLQVAGKGTYNNFYINLIGAQNPANSKKGFYNVTPEQVVSWDPDIVLMNGFEPKLGPDAYIKHPRFPFSKSFVSSLGLIKDAAAKSNLKLKLISSKKSRAISKAAKEKKVYSMPLGGYRWDPPNQESPLTWMWLGMLAYPESHNYNLKLEMDRSYKMLYGKNISENDIKQILKVKLNKQSYKYLNILGL